VQGLLEGDAPFALSAPMEDGGRGGVLVVGESGRLAGGLEGPESDDLVEVSAQSALENRRSTCQAIGSRKVFIEVLRPPPRLLVCGAGDDARPLVMFAAAAGFRVYVADPRTAYATRERFPEAREVLVVHPEEAQALPADRESYAVVMTHSLKRDTEWVRRLHATPVPYIGLLGPRVRTSKILEELGIPGSDRVYGPVGLDLGADGPEQVALAVVAEVLSVWAGREPRHLREREEAVHARA
jgi:xanthine dehydrogenase accessory factor